MVGGLVWRGRVFGGGIGPLVAGEDRGVQYSWIICVEVYTRVCLVPCLLRDYGCECFEST